MHSPKLNLLPNVPPVNVTGVSISPKTSTAETGVSGSRQLNATVEPSDADNKGVSYSIEPETDGLTVSNGGKIDWDESVPAGDYTTTVTTDDGNHTDTHVLTLEEPQAGE